MMIARQHTTALITIPSQALSFIVRCLPFWKMNYPLARCRSVTPSPAVCILWGLSKSLMGNYVLLLTAPGLTTIPSIISCKTRSRTSPTNQWTTLWLYYPSLISWQLHPQYFQCHLQFCNQDCEPLGGRQGDQLSRQFSCDRRGSTILPLSPFARHLCH